MQGDGGSVVFKMNLSFPIQKTVAFTLVELLSAIAIIAILAGLLLPTIKSLHRKGEGARCLGNLRVIGGGVQLFSQEYDGVLPKGFADESGEVVNPKDLDATVNVSWARSLQAFMVSRDNINSNRWGTVFFCPGGKRTLGYTTSNVGTSTGYGLNTGLESDATGSAIMSNSYVIRPLKVKQPSLTMLAADCYGTTIAPNVAASAFKSNLDKVSPRHDGNIHLLYLDGHAGMMDVADLAAVQAKGQNDPAFKTLFFGL